MHQPLRIQGKDYPAPPDLTPRVRQHADARYVGVASIPRRSENLRLAISTLYDQADHFFIYLNDYETVPDWMSDPKITYHRSQDYFDLNATGKVFFANYLDDGFYFTIDDDFVYPANYLDQLVATMDKYARDVAVCVHGSIFPEQVPYYYLRTAIFQYQQQLLRDRFVCLPGTGSFGVHLGRMPLKLDSFLPDVMVDLACAILCKTSGVPLVSIRRPQFWLQNTDREGLYQKFLVARTHHSDFAEAHAPWSFSEYAPAIRAIGEKIDAAAQLSFDDTMDEDAFVAARTGQIPRAWSKSSTYYELLIETMKAERLQDISNG